MIHAKIMAAIWFALALFFLFSHLSDGPGNHAWVNKVKRHEDKIIGALSGLLTVYAVMVLVL